jgi:hydroxylysine kinase
MQAPLLGASSNDQSSLSWASRVEPFGLDVIKDGIMLDSIKLNPTLRVEWIAGRQEDAVHIILAHESCSRRHASLKYYPNGQLFLTDLGSAQGTTLNKVRLKIGRPNRIRPGDYLHFGASSRSFFVTGPTEQQEDEVDNAAIAAYRAKLTAETAAQRELSTKHHHQEHKDDVNDDPFSFPTVERLDKDEKLWKNLLAKREKARAIENNLNNLISKEEANGELTETQHATLQHLKTALIQLHEQFHSVRDQIHNRNSERQEARVRSISDDTYEADTTDVLDTTALTADASRNWRMRNRTTKVRDQAHNSVAMSYENLVETEAEVKDEVKLLKRDLLQIKENLAHIESQNEATANYSKSEDHGSSIECIVRHERIEELKKKQILLERDVQIRNERLMQIEELIKAANPDAIHHTHSYEEESTGDNPVEPSVAERALELEQRRKLEKPIMSIEQAINVAKVAFGLTVDIPSVKELDSYDDRNFYFKAIAPPTGLIDQVDDNLVDSLSESDTVKKYHFVLKVHNGVESGDSSFLHCQNEAMQRIRSAGSPADEWSWCPRALPSLQNSELIAFIDGSVVSGTNKQLAVRLLPYKTGNLLGNIVPDDALLQEVGKLVAHCTTALQGFDPPGAHRPNFLWDLRQASAILPILNLLPKERQDIVSHVLQEYEDCVMTQDQRLRLACIHGDINDQNVLVRPDQNNPSKHNVVGLLDFGDMCHSWLVGEVAIAVAYAIIARHYPSNASCVSSSKEDTPMIDDFSVAGSVLRGYSSQTCNTSLALTPVEWSVLPTLIATRISVSLALGTYSSSKDPDNEYLRLTLEPGWKALKTWRSINSTECTQLLRKKSRPIRIAVKRPTEPDVDKVADKSLSVHPPTKRVRGVNVNYHTQSSFRSDLPPKQHNKEENVSTWTVPKGQKGDGKTSLNDKFGY